MNIHNFKELIEKRSLQDLWWLALDENVLDEQLTLDQVSTLRKQKPNSTFALLNVAMTEEADADWTELDDEVAPAQAADEASPAVPSVARELKLLRDQVNDLQNFIKQIHGHFIAKENLELKEVELKERERFLEESEEALLMKIQQQEEQLAELEQIRDDIGESGGNSELKAV